MSVALGDAEPEGECDAVPEGERLPLPLPTSAVMVSVAVGDWLPLALGVSVAVSVGLEVALPPVAVCEAVGEREGESVPPWRPGGALAVLCAPGEGVKA